MRTKRFVSILLAAILSVTSVSQSYAEGLYTTDVSGQYEETVSNDVSDNASIEEEVIAEDISASDYSDTIENREPDVSSQEKPGDEVHKFTLDASRFFIQQGGLESAEVEEYEEGLEDELCENLYDSSETARESDINGAVAAIHDAVGEYKETIDLSKYNLYCDATEASEEYLAGIVSAAVSYEPSYFYFEGIESYTTDEEGFYSGVTLTFNYNAGGDAYMKALTAAYEEAVTDPKAPDYIKAMQCHDWLVQHVDYDIDFSNPNKYTAYGAIVDHEAVCMGYSLAYGDLLTMAGIKCGYVQSSKLNHMWNIVQIDGKWYNVDTTWDDPLGRYLGTDRYWFFLKSTQVFKNEGDHTYGDWVICPNNTYSYFTNSVVSMSNPQYDHAWWNDSVSAIIYESGYFYYVYSESNNCYKNYIVKRDHEGNQEKIIDLTSYRWTDNEFASGPIRSIDIYGKSSSANWSALSYAEGYLFYNTPKNVYRVRLADETYTPVSIYEVTKKDTFIWTSLACEDKMYMLVGSAYSTSNASTKTTYLFPITNFKLNTKNTTLTHGSSTKAVLSASYNKNSASPVGIKWEVLCPGASEYEVIEDAKATSYSVDPKVYDAGKYKFRLTLTIEEFVFTKTAQVTINKENVSIKNKDYSDKKAYDGKPVEAPKYENFTTNADTLSFSWHTSSEATAKSELESEPYKAGTYYLKASFAGNTNVKSGSIIVKVVISKRPLKVVIGDQTLYYGETITSTVSDVTVTGLAEGDSVADVRLVQSTVEPVTDGKISCSTMKIFNGTEFVTSCYNITYTKGKLVINKLPITVTAKDQNITYGDLISSEPGDVTVTGTKFNSSFVLTSVSLATSLETAGVGTVTPEKVTIHRRGTMTDVTKYFDITYKAGVLNIAKAKTETSLVEITKRVQDYSKSEETVNVYDELKVPKDAGELRITITPSSLYFNETTGELEIVSPMLARGETWGCSVEIASPNYETMVYRYTLIGATQYQIYLYANGGSFPDGEELELGIMSGDTIPDADELGLKKMWHSFEGWYTDPDGGEQVIRADINNQELYARWNPKYKVADVTSDVSGGDEVPAGTRVELKTATAGAKIYYTLDGSEPNTNSNLYNDAIVVTEPVTIKAYGVKDYYVDSDVLTLPVNIIDEGWGDVEDADRPAAVEDIPSGLWTAGIESKIYNGKAQTQADLRVYYGKKFLVAGEDYKVKYSNNTNKGDAKIKITGKGNYSGTSEVYFAIDPADISLAEADALYIKASSKDQKPLPTLTCGGLKLKADRDYTVTYENKVTHSVDASVKDAGTYKIILTGKDNYTGTKEVDLTVTDYILMSKVKVSGIASSCNYTGEEIGPKLKFFVKYDGKALALTPEGTTEIGTDCYYRFENNVETGTAKLVITGAENTTKTKVFVGEKTVTFKIKGYRAMSKVKITYNDETPYACTGAEIMPDFTLKFNSDVLVAGTDFTYTVSDNVKPGNIRIVCKGKGKYTGSKTFKVALTAKSISKAVLSGFESTCVYTGEAIEQDAATLEIGDDVLVKDVDYTVTYKSNTKTGTANVTFTGINEYTGTIKKKFKITKYNILTGGGALTLNYDRKVAYQKNGAKPSVTLTYNGIELIAGKDYSVSYSKNKEIGNRKNLPTLTITGKGNFTGSIKRNFMITKADISAVTMTAADKTYSAKAGKYMSAPVLKDTNGAKLKAGTDYEKNLVYTYGEDVIVLVDEDPAYRVEGEEIDCDDIIPYGTKIVVTAIGKGKYTGEISTSYTIVKASISKARATVAAQTYTGRAVTPGKSEIEVIAGGVKLDPEDYEITGYSDNIKKGNGYVFIRGVGNYTGNLKVKFKIGARLF